MTSYDENLQAVIKKHAKTSTPFYILDINALTRKLSHWNSVFPKIKPFYAIKCNPGPKIVAELANLGIGFDCASINEISLALESGATPENIIFANPHKPVKDLNYAVANGVTMMTFDCCEELEKINSAFENNPAIKNKLELIIRVKVDISKSLSNLNDKYGVQVRQAKVLLEYVKNNGLNLIGVSFHVGNLCYDTRAYENALLNSKAIFEMVDSLNMPKLRIVDIGGGFPGGLHGGIYGVEPEEKKDDIDIETIAEEVNRLREQLFPDPNVEFIAEPGRFFAEPCQTLVLKVISRKIVRRVIDNKITKIDYIVDHGVHGGFKDSILMNFNFPPNVLYREDGKKKYMCNGNSDMLFESSFYGPTGENKDCINQLVKMPILEVGAILYFKSMGAYTSSISSERMNLFEVKMIYERIN